jgi:ribosomal protein S18 acetylase RimI-like enzyme
MVQIRRATEQDIEQLTGLVEQYRAFYKQELSDKTKSYLLDRLAKNESVIFVAQIDNKLVGFTQCYPTFSTVSLSSVWLLNDLFVDPNYRGQKIADQLMQVAEDAAKESGASRIWLRTAHTNLPAQALYEGRGWAQDEVFRRYDLIF